MIGFGSVLEASPGSRFVGKARSCARPPRRVPRPGPVRCLGERSLLMLLKASAHSYCSLKYAIVSENSLHSGWFLEFAALRKSHGLRFAHDEPDPVVQQPRREIASKEIFLSSPATCHVKQVQSAL